MNEIKLLYEAKINCNVDLEQNNNVRSRLGFEPVSVTKTPPQVFFISKAQSKMWNETLIMNGGRIESRFEDVQIG